MGHGMAKNLREKLPASSNLVIYDINKAAASAFIDEFGNCKNIVAAASPREVTELAVRILQSYPYGCS